ncbi:MAG: hypothetical protein WA883_16850 [Phormidesmis sp.]
MTSIFLNGFIGYLYDGGYRSGPNSAVGRPVRLTLYVWIGMCGWLEGGDFYDTAIAQNISDGQVSAQKPGDGGGAS